MPYSHISQKTVFSETLGGSGALLGMLRRNIELQQARELKGCRERDVEICSESLEKCWAERLPLGFGRRAWLVFLGVFGLLFFMIFGFGGPLAII